MKLSRFNYLNILVWCTLLVIPYLAQDAGIIATVDWKTSYDNGFISVITGSFLHGSYSHLMANLPGILLGTTVLLNFQKKMYFPVIIAGIIFPPLFYYYNGASVVGISGLLYTLLWYIIFRGLMSRDRVRFAIGVAFLIFYGASIQGASPAVAPGVAWASHLGGLLVAFNLALYQRLIPEMLKITLSFRDQPPL